MLKILISGPSAEGKTTLAQAIGEFLIKQGFENVKVTDEDLDVCGHALSDLQKTRMKAIKDNHVHVCTLQTKRGEEV